MQKGWSQVEMAHLLGIDRGHISDLEREKQRVFLCWKCSPRALELPHASARMRGFFLRRLPAAVQRRLSDRWSSLCESKKSAASFCSFCGSKERLSTQQLF